MENRNGGFEELALVVDLDVYKLNWFCLYKLCWLLFDLRKLSFVRFQVPMNNLLVINFEVARFLKLNFLTELLGWISWLNFLDWTSSLNFLTEFLDWISWLKFLAEFLDWISRLNSLTEILDWISWPDFFQLTVRFHISISNWTARFLTEFIDWPFSK